MRGIATAGAVAIAISATGLAAQTLPPGVTQAELMARLATDNKLFLQLASKAQHWEEPAAPLHIAGPLYFVGTRGLGAFIFATPQGLILMNTGMPSSGPMIADNIRKLGFDPATIRYLINGHAHIDHAGAMAYFKALAPGAQVAVMADEVAKLESGGRNDFKYGDDFAYTGVKVDKVLRNGDRLRLGDVVLDAYLTPGHTQGATTWIATIIVDGKPVTVAFPDGAGFNPGYRVAKDPIYPGINADFRNTHHTLEMIVPDIWLAQHNEYYDLDGKRARVATEGVSVWFDPEGYRRFIAAKKLAFEAEVDTEMGVKPAAPK